MTEKNQQNQTKNLLKSLNAASGTPPINRADNTLPQAAALKVRFKASSIPLQTDFADLIDIASIGRQAVGGAEGQTGPADGLTLSETGRLELKANPVKGIYADKDGLAIRVGDGLKVDGRGVNVKGGNGIAVDSNGVSVKLAMGAQTNGGGGQGKDGNTSGGGGGLILNADGLSVDAGDGMQINSHGVSIKLASNSGLRADESNGLSLRLEQNKGLQISEAGVRAGVGKGMRISDTGMIEPAIESYRFSDNKNGTEYSPLLVNTVTNELVVDLHQGLVNSACGLSVKADSGLITNESGVNIRLAKGAQTNGGGGQGADGTTSGGAGGLFLDANGLSVDAGDGIQINPRGVSIKLASNSGLRADESNGLSLRLEQNKGLQISEAGVRAGVGKGMRISDTGMIEPDITAYSFNKNTKGTEYSAIKVNSVTNELVVDLNQGLVDTSSGLSVKTGNGLITNESGVNITLAKGAQTNGGGGQGADGTTSGGAGGLFLDANGLSVDAGDGIQINPRGVSIKLASNSGLSADESNGLKIVPEQMFKKGMIMMFAGKEGEMPIGWGLCDGKDGRPDLRDRFILGSNGFTNVNKTNSKKAEGINEAKSFMVSSDAKSPSVSVNVHEHTLTVNQIPPHSHGIRTVGGSEVVYANGGWYGIGINETSKTGGGQGHSHQATANQSSHDHKINVMPPYYILAFIIKL